MSESAQEPTPGTGIFGPSVDAFDERVDQLLEIVRSSKTAGRVFLAASRLGDFSVVWHLIAVSRAMTGRPTWCRIFDCQPRRQKTFQT